MKRYMEDKERETIWEIVRVVEKLPSEQRQYILGYAHAAMAFIDSAKPKRKRA